MSVNSDKTISRAFLKTTNPLAKKWYVCFRYKNTQGITKVYQKTYELNKSPYVVNGVVNTKTNIIKERLSYGQEQVKVLNNKIQTTVFDTDKGIFNKNKEDSPLFEFLDMWLKWKSNKVKSSSLLRYTDKVQVLKNYLISNNKESISLKNFNYDVINDFLIHLQRTHSNSLYNYYLLLINNFINFIIKIEKVKIENEAISIEKVKEDDTEKHAKYSDVHKAFDALTKHHYYLGQMAKTIYYTLHRIDTITKLQLKDFDLKNALINIPSAKIKTGNKLTIRISKHLIDEIRDYVNEHKPSLNDYWFGHTNHTPKYRKKSITMFAPHKSDVQSFSNLFHQFRAKKSTDKQLFTDLHTLYGFKANGYLYYKEYKDANGNVIVVDDKQIIKITGHKNISILAKYSRAYEATISKDIWDRF